MRTIVDLFILSDKLPWLENYTPYIHVYCRNINCEVRFNILRIIKHFEFHKNFWHLYFHFTYLILMCMSDYDIIEQFLIMFVVISNRLKECILCLSHVAWCLLTSKYNTNWRSDRPKILSIFYRMTLYFLQNKSICYTTDIVNHLNVAFIIPIVVCDLSHVECNQKRKPLLLCWG